MALSSIALRYRRPARSILLASAALSLGQACGRPPPPPAQEETQEEMQEETQQEPQELQQETQEQTPQEPQQGTPQQTPEEPQQGTQGPPPEEMPEDPEPQQERGLPPETVRVAFASQCAQNVITCTAQFPVPKIRMVAGPNQVVTSRPAGFLVQGNDADDLEEVQLIGSESEPGINATQVEYSWSYGAVDADPRTMRPGTEFSIEPDTRALLQEGFHYIRLTVTNDTIIPLLESEQFGILGENVFASDFLEIEIEVRD